MSIWALYPESLRPRRYINYNQGTVAFTIGQGISSLEEAKRIQTSLARQVIREGKITSPRFIGGVDLSFKEGVGAQAAIVVLRYPGLEPVEIQVARGEPRFPYIPGLLSFREIPLIGEAYAKLKLRPDLLFVDGQGIAHPRRIGLASHLGLILDLPTIGCAKSRLCGHFEEPGVEAGDYSMLVDTDEVIGAVLRTRAKVKPVFVSVGHRISLGDAIKWTLKLCRGYRLPQPARLAHLAASTHIEPQPTIS